MRNEKYQLLNNQIKPEYKLGLEILEILTSKYILETRTTESENPNENLVTNVIIARLFDDIILRLCKICDTDKNSRAVPYIIKKIKKMENYPKEKLKEIEENLKELLKYVSDLTKLVRNKRIAHIGVQPLQKEGSLPVHQINKAIYIAVNLIDSLGEKNKYLFGNIDLRNQLSIKTTQKNILS